MLEDVKVEEEVSWVFQDQRTLVIEGLAQRD